MHKINAKFSSKCRSMVIFSFSFLRDFSINCSWHVYQALQGFMRYRENEKSLYDQLALPTHKTCTLILRFFSDSNRTGLEFDRCLTRTYMSDALIARSRRLPRVTRISIASRGKCLRFRSKTRCVSPTRLVN